MSAIVRIAGPDADCDELLRLSPVEPCTVWRRGEPKFPASQANSEKLTSSGINLVASEAGFDEFETQLDESIEFLDRYFAELESLTSLASVDTAVIHFGLQWYDTFAQTDFIPAKLVTLAGRLGLDIALSHYPISEDDDETAG